MYMKVLYIGVILHAIDPNQVGDRNEETLSLMFCLALPYHWLVFNFKLPVYIQSHELNIKWTKPPTIHQAHINMQVMELCMGRLLEQNYLGPL